MPIYEYRCSDGHQFEVIQSMSDDPVAECEVCGKPVERVFHPIAVHFKGSGFYTTDYARKGAAKGGDGAGDSKGEKKSETKSEGKSSSEKASSGTGDKASKGSGSGD